MQIEALLCDAATVRENLLHVLGGGVSRIRRPQFPAELGLDLALVFTLSPSEAQAKHRLRVLVQTADGVKLAEAIADIGVTPSDLKPGERLIVPAALSLKKVPIPAEGVYGVEVLVDENLQRSFTFVATLVATKPS